MQNVGNKLPLCLLCTIINTSSDTTVLPKNWHFGEMKLLSSIDDPLKPLLVKDITYAIDSDYVDVQWMQLDSSLYNQCRTPSNW